MCVFASLRCVSVLNNGLCIRDILGFFDLNATLDF